MGLKTTDRGSIRILLQKHEGAEGTISADGWIREEHYGERWGFTGLV